MSEGINRPRYYLLDELRGLSIILMVVYHAFYLLSDVFGIAAGRVLKAYMQPVQPFIAGTFILVCGICCRFSRSNFKRGLRLLGAALLITLCTFGLTLFGINEIILFGVLHFLTVAILLFVLVEKPLNKIPPLLQIFIFIALFFVSAGPLFGRPSGIGAGRLLIPFPKTDLFPLFILGFPSEAFVSADYFSLLPWLFLFLAGTAIGMYGLKGRFPAFFEKSNIVALQWIGRHSLLIYLLHQPIMYLLILLLLPAIRP